MLASFTFLLKGKMINNHIRQCPVHKDFWEKTDRVRGLKRERRGKVF